jgi:hypothetical protein
MAAPKKTEVAAAAADRTDGTLPLVKAVHRIVYGKGQVAEPATLFTPTSQSELDELVKLEAVENPSEAELALFGPVDTDDSLS